MIIFGFVFIILLIVFFCGPRVKIDSSIQALILPDDLDKYLQDSEAAFNDIVPGAEKTIIWAGEPGARTPLSIIYFHGYSASRQEAAPLSDIVAGDLGANLFYTRFTGHGRSNEAMLECSVNNWLKDIHEAVEIGRRIGEKIVVIGLSTGGTAATWLAAQPMAEHLAAIILISPNFGLTDRRSALLTWPWGRQLAELVQGREYGWEAYNDEHDKYWTHTFPTRALLPMMGMVKLTTSLGFSSISKPLLVIYSPEDQVVDPAATVKAFGRFGSKKKRIIPFSSTEAPKNHVLAGDILSPGSTKPLAEIIVDFVKDRENKHA